MQLDLVLPSPRVVSRFSCGAASAVATKLAIERHGNAVHIINAFIADEHVDNRRFLADCERWFGREIVVLRDEKYAASVVNVWRQRRFIASRRGAPCSGALKRDVLDAYSKPGDLMVLGYTADPRDAERFDRFIDANASVRAWAPLIDSGITHRECLERVARAGLTLPLMYRLGYKNANCKKCPRGGMGYWNRIRVDFPEDFEETARVQDLLGPGSYFFRDRKTGTRISLRTLDPNAGRFDEEPAVECGALCEWPEAAQLAEAG